MTKIRKWHISEALTSVAQLNGVINELTEDEVLHCLALESSSCRRKSIIDRLISKAVRLNELQYVKTLKEKYHASTI